MCQEAVRKLCNPSESCHVRKVARLLARPLRQHLLCMPLFSSSVVRSSRLVITHRLLSPTAFLEKGEPFCEMSPQHSASTTGLSPCASQPVGPSSMKTALEKATRRATRSKRLWESASLPNENLERHHGEDGEGDDDRHKVGRCFIQGVGHQLGEDHPDHSPRCES